MTAFGSVIMYWLAQKQAVSLIVYQEKQQQITGNISSASIIFTIVTEKFLTKIDQFSTERVFGKITST